MCVKTWRSRTTFSSSEQCIDPLLILLGEVVAAPKRTQLPDEIEAKSHRLPTCFGVEQSNESTGILCYMKSELTYGISFLPKKMLFLVEIRYVLSGYNSR